MQASQRGKHKVCRSANSQNCWRQLAIWLVCWTPCSSLQAEDQSRHEVAGNECDAVHVSNSWKSGHQLGRAWPDGASVWKRGKLGVIIRQVCFSVNHQQA